MNSYKDNLFIDKNILVFGLGKSGLSSLKKLAGNCKSISALDNNTDFILPEDCIKLSEDTKIKFFSSPSAISRGWSYFDFPPPYNRTSGRCLPWDSRSPANGTGTGTAGRYGGGSS